MCLSSYAIHFSSHSAAELSCNDEDLNRLALEELHKKLDDDQDGEVELTETSEVG